MRRGFGEASMVNRLIDVALNNRFIVVVVYLGLAGWGWWVLKSTPIDAIPDLSSNQVIVFTDWLLHVLVVTLVSFLWIRERRLGLQPEPVPRNERVRSSPRRLAMTAGVVALVMVISFVVWRSRPVGSGPTAQSAGTVVQTIRAGDLDIALLSPTGTLRQGRNSFTFEFRRTGTTTLVDVGTVRASANMPMPGMVMSSGLQLTPTGVPGRYAATAEFGMAGAWPMAIEWNGPAGQGSVNFQGGVQ